MWQVIKVNYCRDTAIKPINVDFKIGKSTVH